ncbi:hypothetical protein CCH79_00000611 [Gambusia affinis]|uniref:MRH domain-containing protein n=1 Tax=Gambusia affinis TaxID=33528 RepID=A0A315VWN8_GAMAF|nr:hypothetical protein CCH79_00000611 [Gambusia affinis]
MFFRDKPTQRRPLRLVLWLCIGLGCFLVRSGAEEVRSSLWYQDLCSYKWEAVDLDNKVKYTIKLCESSPPTSCGPSTAVCAQNLDSEVKYSVGDLSLQKLSGTVLDYKATDTCPGGANPVQTSIDFQCGKTMVRPKATGLTSTGLFLNKRCLPNTVVMISSKG